MTFAVPVTVGPAGPQAWQPRRALVLGLGWLVITAFVVVELVINRPESAFSQILGSTAILAAIVFCLVCCTLAAVRFPQTRRTWVMMSIAMVLGGLSQASYVVAAITRSEVPPSAVSDTVGALGYAVPFFAALYFLPRPQDRMISRYRAVLDVVVITVGVVLISEATVLSTIRQLADLSSLGGWLLLAYPVIDVAICAAVLSLAMRQRTGDRLTWLVLGGGLVVVAVTDSVFVRLVVLGDDHLTATPLAAGWIIAPVLIGLSTLIPFRSTPVTDSAVSLPVQLVPYVPIVGALTVLALGDPLRDRFLLVAGGVLFVTVATRQIMIVYENVVLTRDLESQVRSRTAELATLGSIVTSTGDAVVGLSLDNVITAWNPAAEQLYGYPATDVLGRNPGFLTPRTEDFVAALLRDAVGGEGARSFETDWTRPDGTSVPIAMTVSPIIDEAGVQGISVIAGDVSERRRAAEFLEQAREDALESSRLKSEFLATMSHEIRTPMNGVIGLTTLLLETELSADQRLYAEGVRGAGDALLSVINDILDFSKLEAGKVSLEQTDFDARQLVDEIGSLLAPTADAKGLELIAYCSPDVAPALRGDPARLRQILLNLASNAVKFTTEGEVVIKLGTEPLGGDEIRLRAEVVDTGIGIAARDHGRLFQSFSQADASTTRRFGGTGLGLAISRRLVEAMGGSIGVESELGRGSRFWFEVVLGTSPADRTSKPVPDLLRGLRVLIVDDNETNRAILRSQLRSWGMEVDAAVDADMALEWLQGRADEGYPYDLAALDMCMPVTSGIELARSIQDDPTLTGMPLIMLTSSSDPEPAELAAAGIGQWLTKPVRSTDLHQRLLRLMAPLEEDLRSRRTSSSARPEVAPGSRGTLLLVEDNELNQLVAEAIVARLGFRVERAADGLAALTLLQQHGFHGVLMDCHMPHMDGFSATREIRRREGDRPHIPIIAMTAGALVEDHDRCIAAGMDAYVSKPIDVDRLAGLLDQLIDDQFPPLSAAPMEQVGGSVDPAPIDVGRLADLSELVAPDGRGLLASLVDSFLERSHDRLEVIKAARCSDDTRLMGDAAHELKGAAGTIGAIRVARLCRELETTVRKDQPLRVDLLDELATELALASQELRGLDGRFTVVEQSGAQAEAVSKGR